MTEEFTSVAIIGGGFMGAGIAEAAALSGIPVVVRELPQFLEASRRRLNTSLDRATARGKLDAATKDEVLTRITLTSDLNDLAGADLVIEAVSEDIEVKTAIMQSLDQIISAETIVASNTSAIPIAQLASVVSHPRAGGGIAFLLPGAGHGRLGRKSGRGFDDYT
jgi:3-hydroxybutyryl-CoA dehydrogenase